ncbi:cytochrome c [Paraburkholderia agricolaris]|uniref:Cytochrome c n=1 Tax=Paraburkholderia agricolaris TaxID=2152888 RepID=A0ABW8ZWB7_9BURK
MTAAAIALTSPKAFAADDAALVARGEYLARAGDCAACHTTAAQKPFGGGLAMKTPLGIVYSTNISPDQVKGIGNYTEADFGRALREGVARDGHNLYPAMPYPSYAKVSDADVKALYAYFMHGVKPVREPNRPTSIPWPFSMRWPLQIWNLFFLERRVYQPKEGRGEDWNRGAYLVQGLGHCGSCHTPRGFGFQEKALDETGDVYLSGAPIENWYASNLTAGKRTGLGRWSSADIAAFLKTGTNSHASAFGSMTEVINNSTHFLSDEDLRSIAVYLTSLPPAKGSDSPPYVYKASNTRSLMRSTQSDEGARVYAKFCMYCHGADGLSRPPFISPLAGNPNLLEKDDSSAINVTLNGASDIVLRGVAAPYVMPGFRLTLSDTQIAQVVTFIRRSWGNEAPSTPTSSVSKLRKSTEALR